MPHLRAQLARENVSLVLLNGREVLDQVAAVGLAHLEERGHLPVGGRTCRLYAGSGGGIRWVAWSANLQSSWGVSKAFKQELGAWLAEICTPPTEPRAPAVSVRIPETAIAIIVRPWEGHGRHDNGSRSGIPEGRESVLRILREPQAKRLDGGGVL